MSEIYIGGLLSAPKLIVISFKRFFKSQAISHFKAFRKKLYLIHFTIVKPLLYLGILPIAMKRTFTFKSIIGIVFSRRFKIWRHCYISRFGTF